MEGQEKTQEKAGARTRLAKHRQKSDLFRAMASDFACGCSVGLRQVKRTICCPRSRTRIQDLEQHYRCRPYILGRSNRIRYDNDIPQWPIRCLKLSDGMNVLACALYRNPGATFDLEFIAIQRGKIPKYPNDRTERRKAVGIAQCIPLRVLRRPILGAMERTVTTITWTSRLMKAIESTLQMSGLTRRG